MNWDAFGAIAEMIGGVGVIITLVFLAVQIRNTNRQNALNGVQTTVTEFVNAYASATATRVDAELFRSGLANFDQLDGPDKAVFHSKMQTLASGFFQVRMLWGNKMLSDRDLYAKSEYVFLSLLLTPGGRAWWEAYKHLPPVELRDYLESRLNSPDLDVQSAIEGQVWYL